MLAAELRILDPQDSDLVYRAGLAALKHGVEEDAIPLLERAAQARPSDPRLWQVQGLLHRKVEEMAPAISAFAKAAQLAPADPLIAHSLARAHLEAGLASAELFEAARRLAPQDAQVLLGLAAAQAAELGADAAIETLDALLLQHPGWLEGHHALCGLRFQSGQRGGFAASLERALAEHPQDLNLWRTLFVILTQGDLYEAALAAITRGRAQCGDDLLFDANEAVCRAELGQLEAAEGLFERLADLDDATVQVRRVRLLLRQGRPGEAGALALSRARGPAAHMFWPYVATAWRLTGDARIGWLEGDPRLVGVYDLVDTLPVLAELAARLRGLHVAKNQPLEQSVRGGTQTEGTLFARIEPEIRALRAAIVAAVERHVAQLPPVDRTHPLLSAPRGRPVRFSGSWSVRLSAQGHHANHIHPAGWLSSALYVALPEEGERGEAPAGWLSLGEPQAQLGLGLEPFRLVEPKPGRLVLFPSTMWHGTVPFERGERLTVAFDVARPL
jgi:tetratricopeptide (TPR) repeat protein